MRTFSNRTNFWVAGVVAALALWTSAAPSTSYPLYTARWGLSPATTTEVFAVYPAVLIIVLLGFGAISDHIGRRRAILYGLAFELVGVLLFTFAQDVWWLYIGRALSGLGIGLSLSPATAAMVEYAPPSLRPRASMITTAVTSLAIVTALVLSGVLIQYAPLPLHLDYAVLAAVILATLAAAWFLPRQAPSEPKERWRPRISVVVPREQRRVFIAAAASLVCAFALGAVVLSLGGDIVRGLAGSHNLAVTGALLGIFGAVATVVPMLASKASGRTVVGIGSLCCLVAVTLLVLTGIAHSIPLFCATAIVAGAGYSLCFLGGVLTVNLHAPAHHRAGMISAGYLAGYASQGAIAVILGIVATDISLQTAVNIGAAALAVVFLTTFALSRTLVSHPRPAPAAASQPAPARR